MFLLLSGGGDGGGRRGVNQSRIFSGLFHFYYYD